MSGDLARVLVVGQVPPPVGGQALQIQRIIEHKFDQLKIDSIRMNFSESADEIGRPSFVKIWRLFSLIHSVRRFARLHPGSILYFPPAPAKPWPLLRDAILMLAIRRKFDRVIIALHASGQRTFFDRTGATRRLAVAIYGRPSLAILNTRDAEPDAQSLAAKESRVIPIGIRDPGKPLRNTKNGALLWVLSVGHVCEEKGSLDLLHAVAMLTGEGINIRLCLVGPFGMGTTRDQVLSVAATLGIANCIDLPGILRGRALEDCYRNADVLAFPTKFAAESLGVVAIEAMSHGLPVVASRWRGVPYIVDHGVTGLLHEPGDVQGIAAALQLLHRDSRLRESLGSAGRQKFLAQFEESRYWKELGDALRHVAQTQPGLSRSLRGAR
jgi:glycosyltransferase involved in cell wall biosynthesis